MVLGIGKTFLENLFIFTRIFAMIFTQEMGNFLPKQDINYLPLIFLNFLGFFSNFENFEKIMHKNAIKQVGRVKNSVFLL